MDNFIPNLSAPELSGGLPNTNNTNTSNIVGLAGASGPLASGPLGQSILGTFDADLLRGTLNNDYIYGLAGADTIFGDQGDDLVRGGQGADIINGDQGNDRLFGEDANDVLIGNLGADVLTGGSGRDKFVLARTGGGSQPSKADLIQDFTKGTDQIGLADGLRFQDLNFVQLNQLTAPGSSSFRSTAIRDRITGEYLAILNGIAPTDLLATDFTTDLNPINDPLFPDLIITTNASANQITVGDPITFTLTVSNKGNADASNVTVTDTLPIGFVPGAITLSNGFTANTSGQTVTFTGGNILAGGSATLTITAATGTVSPGNVNSTAIVDPQNTIVESDETNNSFTITTGVVTAPEINVTDGSFDGGAPDNILDGDTTPGTADGTDYGSTLVGTALTRTFTIENTGSATLTLSPPTLPTGFSLVGPFPSSVTVGGSATFTVQLNATATGTYSGEISFGNNDSDENPYNFAITGTVTAPEINVTDGGFGGTIDNILDGDTTPSPADGTNFGRTNVGTPIISTFTIQNTGDGPLTLSAPTLPAGFSLVGGAFPTSITAGTSATFSVQLNATASGTFSGEISFANNDSNENPYNFAITGVVNGIPTLAAAAAGAITLNEQTPTIISPTGLGITDVDDANVESATIQITGNFQSGQDVLSVIGGLPSGINVGAFNTATGTLTLTGSASLASYTTALRQIAYTNTSDTPNTATRTVSFTVNDGDINSNTVTRDITVQPVNDPPTRTPAPTYTSNANLTLTVPDGSSDLLTGATDPEGTTVSVVAATLTSVAAAATATTADDNNVTVNADGGFTYRAVAGFVGNDFFVYQIQDSGTPLPAATTNVTATINVVDTDGAGASNSVLWFIDEDATTSANLGTQANPFRSLAAFNAANTGAGNNPADTDFIFIDDDAGADNNGDGAGTYGGGMTLRANQKLIGDGSSSTLAGITGVTLGSFNSLDAFAGTRPTITGGITLNAGNTLRGLTVGNAASFGITGGAVGNLTISEASVNNATGGGFNVGTSGALNVVLDSLSANGGTNGVNLVGTSGTFTANSGNIANSSGASFNISGGSVNTAYSGTINQSNANNAVNIDAKTGGTTTFNGAIAATTTTANAIDLTNNTGSTVNFTGALTLNTTSGVGFNATGGGTVSAAGTNNTITSTTGTALNVANTTIGATGLNFRSIGSNGAANGIVLNTTGSSGGLTVTGVSTTAGSGGTIQNSTGAGILLTNTANVNLSRMNISSGGDDGIRGTTVTGLSLTGVNVTNNGNAAGEAGIDLSNLFGTSTWSGITVNGSAEDNAVIRNNTGTLTNLSVTGSTFSNNSAIGNDGFLLEASGTASITASITGSTFTANRGDHFQASAANSGNLNVVFSGNTLTGGHPTALGQGVTISAATGVAFGGYTGRVNYDIDNNTINGAILSAITANLGTSGTAGTFNGFIRNNRIGTAGTFQSGSTQASGIAVEAHGNGTHTTSITGNTIRQTFDRGINALVNDGNGIFNLTVTGNTILHSDGTNSREAFFLNNGSTTTNVFGVVDSHTVRLNFGGAGALANTLSRGPGAPDDFRIRQRFNSRIELLSYAGTAFDTAAVVAYIQGRNTGSAGEPGSATANDSATVTTDGFFNTTAVPLPS
jgi:Domain of unknown function DUF11/Bacterial Ig domain/RTX calcium-binding nonapeptide repeat (4 copies)